MSEVGINRRVFVQPSKVLAYLERVIVGLSNVSLHWHERNSPHVLWTFGSVLELMQRASGGGTGTQCLWTDMTLGQRSAFLSYYAGSDTLVACEESKTPRFPGMEALGGVVSAARETRRKLYRDLDSVSPTPVLVGSTPFQAAASVAPVVAPKPVPTVPPIPPMEPVVLEATPLSEVCYLQVSPGEVAGIPELL